MLRTTRKTELVSRAMRAEASRRISLRRQQVAAVNTEKESDGQQVEFTEGSQRETFSLERCC